MVTTSIQFTQTVDVPDSLRLARYLRSPDIGPKALFFTCGNTFRKMGAELIRYSHESVHLIMPFDTGGSSMRLKKNFDMPVVGDLRNRLMSLTDRSVRGNPQIIDLFSRRLSKHEDPAVLKREIQTMTAGDHELITAVSDPMRKIIRHYLRLFLENMLPDFDFRGANMGNLVLTGAYLDNERHLESAIYVFSKLVGVLGTVQPLSGDIYRLFAEMENGEIIPGSSLRTGPENTPVISPIKRVFLSDNEDEPLPTEVAVGDRIVNLIRSADIICFPMGSFYTSIIVNLLPKGVGKAVMANPCPKVFIPNTFFDPEQYGLKLVDQVRILTQYLEKDAGDTGGKAVDFILMDDQMERYPGYLNMDELEQKGIQIIRRSLVGPGTDPYIDETLLFPILFSLVY